MQSDLIPLFISFAIASLIGTLSYFLCWAIQKKFGDVKYLGLASSSIIAALVFLEGNANHLILASPALISCFFWLLKDIDRSKIIQHFWIVFSATVASVFFSEWITNQFSFLVGIDASQLVAFIIPSLTPILFWAWKSLTLEPGVDKHLDK